MCFFFISVLIAKKELEPWPVSNYQRWDLWRLNCLWETQAEKPQRLLPVLPVNHYWLNCSDFTHLSRTAASEEKTLFSMNVSFNHIKNIFKWYFKKQWPYSLLSIKNIHMLLWMCGVYSNTVAHCIYINRWWHWTYLTTLFVSLHILYILAITTLLPP